MTGSLSPHAIFPVAVSREGGGASRRQWLKVAIVYDDAPAGQRAMHLLGVGETAETDKICLSPVLARVPGGVPVYLFRRSRWRRPSRWLDVAATDCDDGRDQRRRGIGDGGDSGDGDEG